MRKHVTAPSTVVATLLACLGAITIQGLAPSLQGARASAQLESSAQPPPATGEPTFRTRASGVRIDVLVTSDEKPVSNLTAADFELTDGGVAQQIDVTSLGTAPVDVVIVLDTSTSLGDDGLRHLLRATNLLLDRLRPDDRAALVTFSRLVSVRSPLSREHGRVREMLKRLKPEGTTSVIDATYAATMLETQADRSVLLLVFSDGIDTASWLRAEKVLDTIRRSFIVPYAVVVGEAAAPGAAAAALKPAESREPVEEVENFLGDLVATGGGLFMRATDTNELERHFADALDNFRQRYVLTYTPRGADAPGWHPVTVKVKGPYRVRTRAGYVVQ